ncbi:uncharacterized protein PGTG_00625 [Puccinia graminis f. sp. tritici CRL 75-36-700-3]|uniref:Domain of unknown function at the cortex 1 domain-containing protein n=1 Tax=Puccinia graminis f. sp. tritici (strain CRL 75-36-700-3 / race SCCL) TaxID=418459 RepID=E3JQE0_PUCGT|nr:uncharacterized protein PGTG_00625 [Puccinia graminis f. sp. tritici CRL 75-36-700-3]EFP74669.2 hypothetical protein PGTG_00625 [Puccinia graminis f. sp. tritici CRL 75-36-700-3]
MTKRLKIMIGPNREEMEIAHVNDSSQPTIINSEYFVGRVLIKIRDFEGITADGSPPIRNHVYFDGRSRKFDIQIEGRFKKREGVELYSGEEIHFGSDFDHIVDFPKSAFNAGMRVARWIDPNVFYDLTPPSERPFIMSPYLACMNTLCAWPCPDRLSDALVCLRQSDREDDQYLNSEADDMVPMEQVDPAEVGATAGKKKIGRHPRRYWRFIGLKSDHGRIDAFIAKNSHLLVQPIEDSVEPAGQPNPDSDSMTTGQTTDNEDEEFDDADAFSCRAPSSHATYSTAVEGVGDNRPAINSGSSYRFSPRRIFPRHQISLGAGMRDLYQDAEIEANEREGEAQAQRMIEMMGEDDTMPSKRPSPGPELSPTPNGQESDEALKKSSNKVKHGLKKLKIAFKKITPNLSSASTSTPSPSSNTPSKRKSYSTAFSSKARCDNVVSPAPSTVSRAASRTLPGPHLRDSSPTLRNDSRSAETVKNLARSSSLMPRPQSHYPLSSVPPSIQAEQYAKTRSTSLDQTRSPDFAATMGALKMQSTESSLFTIHQAAASTVENSSPPQGSSRLSIVKSDKEDSTRLSSSSTSHSRSNRTSATSRSPVCSDVDEEPDAELPKPKESRFTELSDYSQAKDQATADSPAQISGQRQTSSPTAINSEVGGSPRPGSSVNHTPVSRSRTSLLESEKRNTTPEGSASNSAAPTVNQAPSTPISKSLTQTSTAPSQAEIDEAPELEDVEVGDLMFANMLNLAGESPQSHDPVQEQLGPWRFKNPTTDILEDNTFVFLDKSVNVQKRRKHFSENGGKFRKAFTYDPDVVYATSFFSPFMDFNTFDLAIGPVKINVAKVFGDMPVRYTLRSTRIDARNNVEEEIFVTISFELVDA